MRVSGAFFWSVIFLFAAGMGGESALRAQDACTAQSLNGAYTYTLHGSYVGDQFGDLFDFSAAGRFVADGGGSFSGAETASQGETITRGAKYTGTYTVNDDCTGSAAFRDSSGKVFANLDLVITSNGKEIELIETDQGTNISGTGHQQFPPQ
jgi:hypothetical protein